MIETIRALQDAGVEPDVWKIEGLDRREDCEKTVETARRDGRTRVGCIVLGRGSDEQAVLRWLTVAAGVHGFIGFAVGRTTWLEAVTAWRARRNHEGDAVARIAGALPRVGGDLRTCAGPLMNGSTERDATAYGPG